jgi:16S rRNA C967 or C1407 C5-methylase (RsmB/RsmF family)
MELTEYLKNLLGDDHDRFITAAAEPPTIAANLLRSDRASLEEQLRLWQLNYRPHPVNTSGYILQQDSLPLSHTLSYFCGRFRHQGLSSQLPVPALDPQPGETILDLSAAPGSKAIQIADRMQNRGRLVLNDASVRRLEALMANLSRASVQNDIVLNMPGQMIGRLFPEYFDRVLADVPCSGLHYMPDRVHSPYWNVGYLSIIANIQEQLLISAIKAAKVNGVIVYSTCSIAPEENEMVVSRILQRYPVQIEAVPDWPIASKRPGLLRYGEHVFPDSLQHAVRLYPFPDPWEGFFLVRLRKTGSLPVRPVNEPVRWLKTRTAKDPEVAAALENIQRLWGIDPSCFLSFRFLINEHKLWLLHDAWDEIPDRQFVKAGMALAIRKSHVWRLTHSSAQWLGRRITNGLLELSSQQLQELFFHGQIEYPGRAALAYHILSLHEEPIAVVAEVGGRLKIKLPHRFNILPD